MKIDVTQELLGLDDTPIMDGDAATTLRDVLIGALTQLPRGETPDGAVSVKKFNLALSIQKQDTVDLSVEEAQLLMDLTGKMYMPLISGRVWHILDPTTM